MAGPGGSHPGRSGGERSSRSQNDRERGNRDRDRDRSQHPGRVGGEQAARASSSGGRPSGRPGGDHPGRVGGEQAQGASSVNAPSVDRFKDARAALGGRIRDEADLENTPVEDFGNVLAGLAGFHELEPDFDINNTSYNADWGFDVLGALAGIGGMAVGAPGLGTVVSQGLDLLGVRDDLSVNLGTLNSPEDDLLGSEDDLAMGDGSPATDAMDGAGQASGIDAGVDDMTPERDQEAQGADAPPVKKPVRKPPKPPRPYSTVGLRDVVSIYDQLGV